MAEAIVPVKRSKTLFIVLASLALLVIIAGMAAMLLIHNKQLANFGTYAYTPSGDKQEDTPDASAAAPMAPANSGKHVFTSLETFTANLAELDRDRFAQIAIIIELGDAKASAALGAVLPIVRSEVLLLLTSKTASDLLSLKGKQALASQIVEIARKYISPEFRQSVFAAHFSSFVIQ